MAPHDELFNLLNQLVEDQLDAAAQLRLNEILQSDEQLVDVYADYLSVHGQLYWDAGLCAPAILPHTERPATGLTERRSGRRFVTVAATVIALIGLWNFVIRPGGGQQEIVENVPRDLPHEQVLPPDEPITEIAVLPVEENDRNRDVIPSPLKLNNPRQPADNQDTANDALVNHKPKRAAFFADSFVDADVSAKIDELLATAWSENEISPTPVAGDDEWVRRVYLTFAGRIPTLNETQAFLKQQGTRKYTALISDVSHSPERASHLAVVWSNLLVGRTEKRGVNRQKLFEYLADSFGKNEPWVDMVGDLVAATGRNDQNGATNFLLAHLNNQATPATAVTARLFLGEQISCVQCHDHPFTKELRQQDYWELNAFFKDTNRVSVPVAISSATSQTLNDIPWKLVDRRRDERMTYFETRAGLEKAVLPSYDSQTLPADSTANRRAALARLLAADSSRKVAGSMVNRMWAHFFGYGFTPEVDDMGPHVAVSHPELLDLLTEAFVKSGYDVQRLMTWIAATDAWRRGSELTENNAIDSPDDGEIPLFSRVYVRRMTPEQVYESIRVAILSASDQPVAEPTVYSRHRRDWVGQFAQSYDTDENDESMNFDGTISQAMVMMNGDEVDEAIRQATLTIVGNGSGRPVSSSETLNRVALAMLTRGPTEGEQRVFRSHYRKLMQQQANAAMPRAVEDMMWAYLNSSEFVLVH